MKTVIHEYLTSCPAVYKERATFAVKALQQEATSKRFNETCCNTYKYKKMPTTGSKKRM